MIGASKILTVSYGTFSCTLEGFDDPFNTMKAIAEYFRDLAAEDRYFGAEPPTPDAAMLHKIAEREIHRRVEAKIQDNGVILRAGDDLAPEAPTAPRAALAVPQTPVFEAPPTQTALPPIAPAPSLADPQPTPMETAIADSVAAKLLRIRNAVAQAAPAVVAAPETDYSEDQHAADIAEPADFADGGFALDDLGAAPAVLPEEDAAQLQDMLADDEALPEEFAAEVPAEVEALAEVEGLAEVEALAEVVPEITDLPAAADVFPETADELPAEPPVAEIVETFAPAEDDDAALLASLGLQTAQDAPAPDLLAEADMWPEENWPEADPVSQYLADADLEDADFADADLDDAEVLAAEDLDDLAALDAALADAPIAAAVEPLAPLATDVAEEAPEATAELTALAATEAEADVEARPAISEKAQRARARVIKIRRAEPAAATTAPADADLPGALSPDAGAAALSAEAEADLQRELAELERGTSQAAPLPPVQISRPLRPVAVPGSESRDRMDDTASDAAVNRLIAQTNTEMAGPENRRRLSAIAHLKAAVIATIADRRAGGTPAPSEADRIDPYRSDLTRLVRPANPALAQGDRPAPLVLVSEQRVDRKPEVVAAVPVALDAGNGPVRPRRVSVGSNLAVQPEMLDDDEVEDDTDANIFTDTKGFAEFAERLGAQGLPALLEAAAAYAACVEGRPHFSRPHLIHQISAAAPEAGFSREDSLRGFGSLLRSGKITKIKRGQFVLAESSHYLAEARKLLG